MITSILIAETNRNLPPEARRDDTLVLTRADWQRKLHGVRIDPSATATVYVSAGQWSEQALKAIQYKKSL